MWGMAKAIGRPIFIREVQIIYRLALRQAQNLVYGIPLAGKEKAAVLPWQRIAHTRKMAEPVNMAPFACNDFIKGTPYTNPLLKLRYSARFMLAVFHCCLPQSAYWGLLF